MARGVEAGFEGFQDGLEAIIVKDGGSVGLQILSLEEGGVSEEGDVEEGISDAEDISRSLGGVAIVASAARHV
jgi:hypothetical protein